MQNTAVMPDIMLKFLILDTDGQHSTLLYDKRDNCSFTITHFPQNNISKFEWLVIVALRQFSNFFQLYHGENKLFFSWDDDETNFVLDQHTELDF